MTRVYLDGAFDMFHAGHVSLFKKARGFFQNKTDPLNCLLVGVLSDRTITSYKRRPIIDETLRLEVVEACTYVDEVIVDAPLVVTEAFITSHHIDIIVHGDDSLQKNFYEVPLTLGIMRYIHYDPRISSTTIIEKVLKTPQAAQHRLKQQEQKKQTGNKKKCLRPKDKTSKPVVTDVTHSLDGYRCRT